ncbi:hypothetical protein OPQ81_003929 [Rhizoctonia solani]|nr:hypothetical protein OPQ81_003929 [Rhizoctonia solani]
MAVSEVRSTDLVQAVSVLTLDPTASSNESVLSGERMMVSLDLSNKVNPNPQIHRSFTPSLGLISSLQSSTVSKPDLSDSLLFNEELPPWPIAHIISLNLGRAELGCAKAGQYVHAQIGEPSMAENCARAGINLTLTQTTDSSYSSTSSCSSKDTGAFFVDFSCPPPPRACITMDLQGQALLDKKLRKMGGWKSRFLITPSLTRANSSCRSAMRRVLEFVRDDLVLR